MKRHFLMPALFALTPIAASASSVFDGAQLTITDLQVFASITPSCYNVVLTPVQLFPTIRFELKAATAVSCDSSKAKESSTNGSANDSATTAPGGPAQER